MPREFDFGFSLMDENELEVAQDAKIEVQNATKSATEAQTNLDTLYNAIQPLLNNLKANPEKEYIYWPDRSKKIEEFSDFIDKIYHNDK